MSRPLWGESEAGSWAPLPGAGPGCCPPPLYNYKPNYYLQRRRGGALVVLVSSVCQSVYWPELDSPSALCLGLPVTKTEEWDIERAAVHWAVFCFKANIPGPSHTVPPSPAPKFSVHRHLLQLWFGQFDRALHTHFMWPISNLLIWWLNSSSSSSLFF